MGNTVGSQGGLTPRQKEILLGMILGDCCLEKNGKNVRLRVEHGLKQKNYLYWKYEEFKNLATDKPRLVKGLVHPKTKKIYRRWHFSSYSIPELNNYWHKFYFQKKKIVPQNIVELLTSPLSLAVWFMDDGYKRNDCNALRINTDCFTINGQKLLQKCLKENFDIETKLHKKGKFWNIYIPNPQAKKFCNVIKSHINDVAGMGYKIFLTP